MKYEALTLPLTRLTGEGSEADAGRGLLVFGRAERGHGGDELVGSGGTHAVDAGESFSALGQLAGGNGDDTLFGDAGDNDKLFGGNGADTLLVGPMAAGEGLGLHHSGASDAVAVSQ